VITPPKAHTSTAITISNFHQGNVQKLCPHRSSPFLIRFGKIKKWRLEFKRLLGGFSGKRFPQVKGQVGIPNTSIKIALDVVIKKMKCICFFYVHFRKQPGTVFLGSLKLKS
jgi:hypothetical protein